MRAPEIPTPRPAPAADLLRPLREYEQAIGGGVVMIDYETLVDMLTRLKRTAIRDLLDTLLDEAARREMTLREALGFLCQREIARKDERRVEMAGKIAHFPTHRDLSGFDFQAQPSLDPGHVRDLAACRWVAHGEALLLLGLPGVGKTHLAIAPGREAIRQGYSVLCVAAPALVAALAKGHAEGRLEERLAFYAKPKLLIIDELGYLPFEPNAAHLFFQLVSRRYERGSLLDHLQPLRGRVGRGLRRPRRGHGHPRPSSAPQPRRHHPRRQLPAAEKAPRRPDQAERLQPRAGRMRAPTGHARGPRADTRSATPALWEALRSARAAPRTAPSPSTPGGQFRMSLDSQHPNFLNIYLPRYS